MSTQENPRRRSNHSSSVEAAFIILSTSGASDAIGEGGLRYLAECLTRTVEDVQAGMDVRTAVENHADLDDYQRAEVFGDG